MPLPVNRARAVRQALGLDMDAERGFLLGRVFDGDDGRLIGMLFAPAHVS
jgi:hypothetical protein